MGVKRMKAKILILSLSAIYALFLIGCEKKEISGDERARDLGLICINGYVFREQLESRFLRGLKITLEPLNIACENAKVILD